MFVLCFNDICKVSNLITCILFAKYTNIFLFCDCNGFIVEKCNVSDVYCGKVLSLR